ncbi:MAG: hypothetical protein V3U30_03695 [Thermoplasmata archaeon]
MRRKVWVPPAVLTIVGALLLVLGLALLPQPLNVGGHSVHSPAMDLSGTDLVIAYIASTEEPSIYVTKLDASLQPVFWNVKATPPLPQGSRPTTPNVRTHEDGSIHILWTRIDETEEFVGPPCQRSLYYSRLSGRGIVLVEALQLTPDEVVEHCGVYHPVWDLDAEGNPVVIRFRRFAELPRNALSDMGCVYSCSPTVRRVPDGPLYGVTASRRMGDRGHVFGFYVALYVVDSPSLVIRRVAVLASTDPGIPVSLPLNEALTVTGAFVSGAGAIALVGLVALKFRGRGRQRGKRRRS